MIRLYQEKKDVILKSLTQAGLEPTISCSVGRRLIHWATEPLRQASHLSNIYLIEKKTDEYAFIANIGATN